ncbi:MAG: M20 family metallopeptidase [Streptosporangiaceae bacterium]
MRIDSQNPGALEDGCAAWVQDRLQGAGLEVCRYDTAHGRPNLVAAVRGAGAAPRLVLLAHMDTVPIGEQWTVDPLAGVIRGAAVWGRGTADMKAGLAVAVGLMESLVAGPPPPGDVVLCVTADEEGPDMSGIHTLVAEGAVRAGDQVLALEPTGLRLRLAQVGLRWLEVEVHGQMAHGGRAHQDGIDANYLAALIVVELKRRVPGLAPEHELLGPPRVTCSGIRGGVAANVVPASCALTLDIRVVPPLRPDDAERLVHDVSAEVCAAFPGGRFEVRRLGVARPSVVADEGSPLVQGLRAAFSGVTGRPLEQGGEDGHEAYTDASMVAALTGSGSCTVWGPGHPSQAHVADEHVDLDDLETAQRVVGRLVYELGRP